jgi:hypothetical protein
MKLWIFALTISASVAVAEVQRYPAHANVVDVTKPPYSAANDGVTDATDALQRALNENVGRSRVLYFPRGSYLVSRTLTWPKRFAERDNWGLTTLRGEEAAGTIIRLKDATFQNEAKPAAMMQCGGFGSADWFHNRVENLTFDVGASNPGATALEFYSNNTGAVRHCRFIANAGSGVVGLDLAHHDMNGPLLVSHCHIQGFQRGITASRAVNSQTLEDITLRGQSVFGIDNEGQTLNIRRLVSENAVPAVRTYGTTLIDQATLTGTDAAAKVPAVINYNSGKIYLRDVTTTGYREALADVNTPDWVQALRTDRKSKPGSEGTSIVEYGSEAALSAFPSPEKSLRLPVKTMPQPVWEAPEKWAVVDTFGADPTGAKDSTAAITRAMNSGATTVFFPGSYKTTGPIVVRGKVNRILGINGWLNYGKRDVLNFRIEDGQSPIVHLECFSHLGGGIEIATKRCVVIRSMETHTLIGTAKAVGGEVFLEDVVGDNFRFRKQKVWATQLNIENEGMHLTNDGGDVHIFSYKTERGGTLAHTLQGGRTEILGGFSYTTTAGALAPMFINDDSSVWAIFGEICFNGDPYKVLVRETRSGVTKDLARDAGKTLPYSGRIK